MDGLALAHSMAAPHVSVSNTPFTTVNMLTTVMFGLHSLNGFTVVNPFKRITTDGLAEMCSSRSRMLDVEGGADVRDAEDALALAHLRTEGHGLELLPDLGRGRRESRNSYV